jgi:hypothetical protein
MSWTRGSWTFGPFASFAAGLRPVGPLMADQRGAAAPGRRQGTAPAGGAAILAPRAAPTPHPPAGPHALLFAPSRGDHGLPATLGCGGKGSQPARGAG